jgi:hypothetical protein
MRTIFLLLLIITVLLQGCSGQDRSKQKMIFNKEFNWQIEIPQGFESVPAEQSLKMQNKGTEAIEKTYNAKVENNTETIFIFKSDQFNYFESNYQPYDTITNGNYLESFRSVNNLLYGTFEAQMPDTKLDSASSQETIDGLLFQTFKVTIRVSEKMTMEYQMYSRLFGKREFTVNIMTVDKEKQKALLDAWKNSKFNSK